MILESALICLASTVYHESRSEPITAQYAVAHVVMNRSDNDEERVCETVKAKNQFSWVKPNKTGPNVKESEAWFKSMDVAQKVLDGKKKDPTSGATHFYRTDIYPKWADSCTRKKKLGKQVFCKV